MPVGPTDLAQLLMIEYASSYGNDWFVVPLTLPVGSLTAVNSLVVTDSFGVRTLLRPIGDRALPRPNWTMWQLAHIRRPGQETDWATGVEPVLPAAVARPRTEGPALEDVLFMRDEMANVAWAIERRIEKPVEQPVPRVERDADAPPMRPPIDRRRRRRAICSRRPCRATGSRCCRAAARAGRQDRLATAARRGAAAGRLAEGPRRKARRSPPRANCCCTTRRCRARGARDAAPRRRALDRRLDMGVDRVPQADRARRRIERPRLRPAAIGVEATRGRRDRPLRHPTQRRAGVVAPGVSA